MANLKQSLAMRVLWANWGKWYTWGGDDPGSFDCSGLVIEYLKTQRRFKHLMDKPEEIDKIQAEVDEKCQKYGF